MAGGSMAAAIRECRRQRQSRGSFAGEYSVTVEQAYAVQVQLAREREAGGDPVVGFKLGLISRAKQEQMQISEPIIGHLHRSMLIQPGEAIPRDRFIQPRVEPELAVVFGRTPPEAARASDLLQCVGHVLLVVDVLDSIYAGYRFTAADVVADNASGGAVALGGRPLPPEVLWRQEGSLRLSLDAAPWVGGTLTELGDPVALMVWAAERARRLGRGLRAGDLLLLGAPCAALAIGDARMLVAEGPDGASLVAPII